MPPEPSPAGYSEPQWFLLFEFSWMAEEIVKWIPAAWGPCRKTRRRVKRWRWPSTLSGIDVFVFWRR